MFNIKCIICGKDATFSIPHYKTRKNPIISHYEYRCNEHMGMKRGIERKLSSAKLKGNLQKEIDKLFPKPIIIEEPISTPTDKISKPSV